MKPQDNLSCIHLVVGYRYPCINLVKVLGSYSVLSLNTKWFTAMVYVFQRQHLGSLYVKGSKEE